MERINSVFIYLPIRYMGQIELKLVLIELKRSLNHSDLLIFFEYLFTCNFKQEIESYVLHLNLDTKLKR